MDKIYRNNKYIAPANLTLKLMKGKHVLTENPLLVTIILMLKALRIDRTSIRETFITIFASSIPCFAYN